jgi:hypothetical protein
VKQVPRVPRPRILLLALPSPARDPPIVLKSSSMAARIWLRGNQESKCAWYLFGVIHLIFAYQETSIGVGGNYMLCECKNYSGSLQIGDLLTGIENKDVCE